MAPPLSDGRITPVATEHGTTGQGEDRHQRVALAMVTAEIWYLGQHLDQGAVVSSLQLHAPRCRTDFVFGLAGNPVLLRHAAPVMQEACGLFQQRTALAHASGEQPPPSSRVYEDFSYAAASWAQPWRVIVKAEVMAAGDNPRLVVTSLEAPLPQQVYEDLYCAWGDLRKQYQGGAE